MSTPAPGPNIAVGKQLGEPGATEADLIAAAVLASPDVVGLHGGRFGEVATYLPGRRIVGVRLRPDHTLAGNSPAATVVEVHVIARYPAAVADLDASVRAAVHTALGPDRDPVSVSIEIGDIVADQPAIGGPVGDRPVLDTPPPVPMPASTPPSEPPTNPPTRHPDPPPQRPRHPPRTDSAVTDRITIDHVSVTDDHDDDPGADPGMELDGAGGPGLGSAAVEGRSTSEQGYRSW